METTYSNLRFSGDEASPYLLIDSCVSDSVAANRSTSFTSSMICSPALCTTSSTEQVAPASTGGTLSSTSGGRQLEGIGNGVASFVKAAISFAAAPGALDTSLVHSFFNRSRSFAAAESSGCDCT